ncbi:hypothetical protein [Streptomyces sp. HPF1205]|uniref:hypothetical protein n=1 Tax=Streptomyces sp. HPF1205 TaxID=2873262 RepID=UPI001CED94F7|nr:hypothetical protein [Streptomyces sp. HPF1205]
MAHEGTSRRAILSGALASAAVIGFGASRVSATARPTTDGGITVTSLRRDDCTYMSRVCGINRSGQMAGWGFLDGKTYAPVLWSDGALSVPLAPDGASPVELVGISDSGQYAGAYYNSGMTALLWTDGVPRPMNVGPFPHTRAVCMDARGRVLVQARTDPEPPPYYEDWTYDKLFLWDRGRITPILPPDGGPWSDIRVLAVNNRGGILAQVSQSSPWKSLPFFWQAGRSTWLTDIAAAGSTVLPSAVNDLGQVAGTVMYAENGTLVERAFRWRAGRSELSPMRLPGATRDGLTVADGLQAINMRGDVIGTGAYGPDDRRPFLWSGNTLTVLSVPEDTEDGLALSVNDRGDVCGYCVVSVEAGVRYRPFLWRAGQRIDLPLPDGRYGAYAEYIDNRGTIISWFVRPGNGPKGVPTGGSTGGSSVGGTSTSGGSVTSGGSTGGGSTGGDSTIGSVDEGATTIGGSGIPPGCNAPMYNCLQWTVPL